MQNNRKYFYQSGFEVEIPFVGKDIPIFWKWFSEIRQSALQLNSNICSKIRKSFPDLLKLFVYNIICRFSREINHVIAHNYHKIHSELLFNIFKAQLWHFVYFKSFAFFVIFNFFLNAKFWGTVVLLFTLFFIYRCTVTLKIVIHPLWGEFFSYTDRKLMVEKKSANSRLPIQVPKFRTAIARVV